MKSTYNRLTDADRHYWFIDIGERIPTWRPFGFDLESSDAEDNGCALHLRAFGWTVRARLPQIIKPWKRDWDTQPRQFGFSFNDGSLHVYLGPQTGDSLTTKGWHWFLPWMQWRFIRFSLYDLEGGHFWTQFYRDCKRGFDRYEAQKVAEEKCPKIDFTIIDHDDEVIKATTQIHEREWRFGEGWFKWLSLFRNPKIRRSLDIRFDKEVGTEKGGWKGGVMGTGIDMLPGELHEAAMRRFCEQDHRSKYCTYRVRFVGVA